MKAAFALALAGCGYCLGQCPEPDALSVESRAYEAATAPDEAWKIVVEGNVVIETYRRDGRAFEIRYRFE